MKTKKIITILIILTIFIGINIVNAKQTIYQEIDSLVLNNKEKAEILYDLFGKLHKYTGKKLGKFDNNILGFSDIYGFNLEKLLSKNLLNVSIYLNSNFESLKNKEDYLYEYSLYNSNTISLKFNDDSIYLYNINIDNFLQKYNKIISGKIKFNSTEFNIVKNEYGVFNSILNVRGMGYQISSFNQHFIKDNKGNIRGIGFYVFEGNGDAPSSILKYKIYSVKETALMEIDLKIFDPNRDIKNNIFNKELIIKDNEGKESIDTKKFQEKYFKKGYFNDGIKGDDYWKEIKTNIDFFEEVVKES